MNYISVKTSFPWSKIDSKCFSGDFLYFAISVNRIKTFFHKYFYSIINFISIPINNNDIPLNQGNLSLHITIKQTSDKLGIIGF